MPSTVILILERMRPLTDYNTFFSEDLKKFIKQESIPCRQNYTDVVQSLISAYGVDCCRTAQRLFEVCNQWDNKYASNFYYANYFALFLSAEDLSRNFSPDILFKVPEIFQKDILSKTNGLQLRKEEIFGYSAALELACYPQYAALANGAIDLHSGDILSVDQLNCLSINWISEDFWSAFSNHCNTRSQLMGYDRISFSLISTVYGEEIIIEILNKSRSEGLSLTSFNLIALIQNWENRKAMPVKWALEMIDTHNSLESQYLELVSCTK